MCRGTSQTWSTTTRRATQSEHTDTWSGGCGSWQIEKYIWRSMGSAEGTCVCWLKGCMCAVCVLCRCVDLYSGGFGGSVSQVDLLLFDLDTDPYERYAASISIDCRTRRTKGPHGLASVGSCALALLPRSDLSPLPVLCPLCLPLCLCVGVVGWSCRTCTRKWRPASPPAWPR